MASCGKQNVISSSAHQNGLPKNLKFGKSNLQDVKKELGEPLMNYSAGKSSDVLVYSKQRSLQLQNNKLYTFFREPNGEEIYLQYWQNLWKNDPTTLTKIESKSTDNEDFEEMLENSKERIIIIFSHSSGKVKRVAHYED